MPRVFLPQILWHSKDNKRCDRVYSIDFQPKIKGEIDEKSKNTNTLRLATGGADEFVHIWQITIHDQAPQYTHFVNNNQNSENNIEFDQPLSIKILARLIGHIGEVNSVRWSHDGLKLATGGEDRCIFLWVKGSQQNNLEDDSYNGYEEYWTRTHYFRLSNVVNTICWCPDDRVLSVSTEDGHISLVDTQVEGKGKIRYFDGHTSFAQGVSLDPKNELLASLGSDQCLRVWKRRNPKMWKSILVLKAARDRGDIVPMNEFETNIELRKYSRLVFMSEELKTFFRRLDWSPDGRLLVAPTGIRHDKNNQNEFTNNLETNTTDLNTLDNQNYTSITNVTNDTHNTQYVNSTDHTNNIVNTDNTDHNNNTHDTNNTDNPSNTDYTHNTDDSDHTESTSITNDTSNTENTDSGCSSTNLNNVFTETDEKDIVNIVNNTTNEDVSELNNINNEDVSELNNINNEDVSELNDINNEAEQEEVDKDVQNQQLSGENSVYTLYVFHRKLLNLGIPMLTHQSPTGPFVVVKFCPIYLSVLDRKRKNFYNLLLNANKNKLRPVKRKLERTSKSHFVTANKINSYFSSTSNKSEYNDMSNNEDLMNEEEEDETDEGYEYENNESGQDEDEVMTILEENPENMDVNMENTTTDTPNNLDNATTATDINLEDYGSTMRQRTVSNSPMSTPTRSTVREDTHRDSSRMENSYRDSTVRDDSYNYTTVADNSYVDSTYGSYSNYAGDVESAEACEQVLRTEQDESTNIALDDYQVNAKDEAENSNKGSQLEEFQTEGLNGMEEFDDEEAKVMEELNMLGVEIRVERPGFLPEDQDYMEEELNMERMEDEESEKEDYEEELENEELGEVSGAEEYDDECVDDGSLYSEVKLEYMDEDEQPEKMEDALEDQHMDYSDAQLESMDEEEDEVKEEGVEEEEDLVKMEHPEGLGKEEGAEEDKKGYNLRKTRKSVIPLIMESYNEVVKRPRSKIKREKKVKSEEDVEEEDYDTDLEDELSIPRFLFAAGTTDGSLCFFDTNENSGPIAVLKNLHFCPITDISWSPDGYVCATSSSDGYITFIIFNKRELS